LNRDTGSLASNARTIAPFLEEMLGNFQTRGFPRKNRFVRSIMDADLSEWRIRILETPGSWRARRRLALFRFQRKRKSPFSWTRSRSGRSLSRKGRKALTGNPTGDSREHASLRDTVYLNWGSLKWGDTLGVSARPRLCGLRALVARSRPECRGAPRRRRSIRSYASTGRSIGRSMDRADRRPSTRASASSRSIRVSKAAESSAW